MKKIMTLNEAIEHCQDIANTCDNKQCAAEHLQLVKWLEELKELRSCGYKKYEEALERAKKLKENPKAIFFEEKNIHVSDYIFPELKESNDEKIKKGLIKYFKNFDSESLYTVGLNEEEIISWLEKQVESIDKEKVLIGARKDVALSIMNFLDRNTLGMCLSNMECKDLEDAVVNSDWSKVYNYMKKKLERQVEKPQGKSALEAINEEKVDNQNCVKTNDKIEHKFNIGDSIIDEKGETYKVIDVCSFYYTIKDCDNNEWALSFNEENKYKLFSSKAGSDFDIDKENYVKN